MKYRRPLRLTAFATAFAIAWLGLHFQPQPDSASPDTPAMQRIASE